MQQSVDSSFFMLQNVVARLSTQPARQRLMTLLDCLTFWIVVVIWIPRS